MATPAASEDSQANVRNDTETWTEMPVAINLARVSTALRVVCVTELVDIIFSFLDGPDNARNARVCKTWSNIALKIIWEEVDDLVALFSILSPMVAGNQPERRDVYVR
ncbi:hypothetical protein D9619_013304 [Psilocybe cf. subviscida]|uniref:F-box domain-containing protein n=1 Tax=Psilocybe cf. subviscida TaxID=2480587 RepID=A0A8H5F991_9AGAR|nr:hypothetical protein D9619_013304 [Psilocybe cf. subviscida]